MRAVVQRVAEASVATDGRRVAEIGTGLLVLVGIARGDSDEDALYLAEKVRNLRIFNDSEGQMNRSLIEEGGEVLVVSQFTLLGDARRGRRPAWSAAAPPEEARALYASFVSALRKEGLKVETGVFQAKMKVSLVNDGPVTILLDSARVF